MKARELRTSLRLFGEVCRKDDVILDEEVAVGSWMIEKRHALALDGLHEPGLCDALAHQRDDVSVQVGQVTREAEQGLSKRGEPDDEQNGKTR